MAEAPDFAPLTAALVRRARVPDWEAAEREPPADAATGPNWRSDVRLFAMTWAAGFVFFLTFIA
jgi:hypothetical protein